MTPKNSVSHSVAVYYKGESEMYFNVGSTAYNSHKAVAAILARRWLGREEYFLPS